MTRWYKRAALGMAAIGLTAASGAQAQSACMTRAEAEALVLYIAPDLIREAGRICAPALPPTALLRQPSGALVAKYRAEADGAWPLARSAFGKLAGASGELDGIMQLLDSQFAKPAAGPMAAQILVAGLDVRDCDAIERAVTLAAPLPPRNAAGLLATLVDLAGREAVRSGKQPRLSICRPPARAAQAR